MYVPTWAFIVVAVIVLWHLEKDAKRNDDFSPIRIQIKPDWINLFKDYEICKDDSWDEKVPTGSEYHLLKHGLTFTILKPNLIYSDSRHFFRTEVDFKERINEVSLSTSHFVGFSVKWGREGYEIGLRTLESAEKSHHIADDKDIIRITTIPYSELGLYKFAKAKKDLKDAMLKKYGWTKEEPHIDMYLVDPTVTLEHKYCTVYVTVL